MTRQTCCDNYRVSRRKFIGAAAGVATLLGMPVRDLMAAVDPKRSTADHVILFWMSGGMSHIDTWDPKPGRATAGEFKPIKTSASGVEISEILPETAKIMHHAALLRSIAGREGAHDRAQYNLLTGYRPAPQLVHPAFGSIVAHEREQVGELPSFVSINGRARAAGYLGQKYEAYFIGNPGQRDPYIQLPEGVNQQRADRRLETLRKMNGLYAGEHPDPYLQETERTYDAALSFMQSPALKAFDLKQEKPETIERYGDNNFGKGALLARRLVDEGVRFVQVSMGGFDTHTNNFDALRDRANTFDPAIASLVGDLAASGKLDRTMVVMLSEFGRTPRINGDAGRDHWPRVFSAFFAGGGVKPGTVIGSSDADGAAPDQVPTLPQNIHATICAALGIDYHKEVQTPLGRPMKLVYEAEVIPGLLKKA